MKKRTRAGSYKHPHAPTASERAEAERVAAAARKRIAYLEGITPSAAEVDPRDFANMCDSMERRGRLSVDPAMSFKKPRFDFFHIVRAVLAWGAPDQRKTDADTLAERIRMAERLYRLIPFPTLERRLKNEVLDVLDAELKSRRVAAAKRDPCTVCGWIHDDGFQSMMHPRTAEVHILTGEHARHHVMRLHESLKRGEPGLRNKDLCAERHPEGGCRDISEDFRGKQRAAYEALIDRTKAKGLVSLKRPA